LGFALAVFALVSLLAAACGGDDDSTTPTAAPTAASSSSAAAASPSAATKTTYPVQVTDLLGRTVTIKAKPTTVVAISPTAVEFVYAAGGTVVGRSATALYPEAARAAKDIGSAYQPSFEQILALKPDLVVADSIIDSQPQLKTALDGLGVPVIFAGADSYQKVIDGMNLMGKVFDSQETAGKAVAGIQKARDDAKKAVAGKTVSALAIIGDRDGVIYAAKPGSYAGDILVQLGVTNPAASQPDAGPFPGYTTVATDKMVEYNPDFIFAISAAPAPAPKLSDTFVQIPPFKALKSVTGKHVIDTNVDLFLQAPGPRIIDAFKAIATALTAP
jgi:iron complex transport system substrate-binding protein